MKQSKPILYIFSGLPGTGKSTLAKNAAKLLKAFYVKYPRQSRGLEFMNRSKRFLLFGFLSHPFGLSGFAPLTYNA
jgi:adenylate kinase